MTKQFRTLQISTSIIAAAFMLSVTLTTVAQSGRRGVKTTSTVPPGANATKEPAASKSKDTLPPQMTLIVGIDRYEAFSRIPMNAYSFVLDSCVDRFRDSPSVKVIESDHNLGRGEAITKAKAGKDADVVWLRVGVDSFNADQTANVNIRDVFIEYIVYAAGTAKIVTQGRTYPQAHRSSTVIPSSKGVGLYGDYLYNQAAREAAERILSALDLPTRPMKIP